MDYNSTRSFTMTLAHRAVGDIRRGGFRQLRNYVDMCATLAKKPQQKDFFAYAQKALQRTDSCYYSMIHRLLDSVEEDRICTVGVNMGFGGLIYLGLACILGLYFTFAAVQGDYGMFARVAINAEAASLRLERDKLSTDLGEMQNLTHRLSDDYLDLDLLDQQTRDVLGYMRADEIAIR